MIRKLILIFIVISLIFLTGCWDRKEPENRALVTVGAYDYNPDTDMYQIITQIESPQSAQGGNGDGGGGGDKPSFWKVSAWGDTPTDAISNIRKKVSRDLHYGHLNLLIISEEMAKTEGIVTVMDTLARSRQSRPIVQIAVAEGDVNKMLNQEFPIEISSGLGLLKQIQLTRRESGTAITQTGRKFLNRLSTPGIEPVAVNLALLEEDIDASKPDTPPFVQVKGLTAFYKDKFAGRLNDTEARGWNWISNQEARGVMEFTYPENKNTVVSANTRRISCNIIPYIKNNNPEIKIELEVEGKIDSITGLNQFKEKSGLTQSMENRLAEAVRNDIKKGINKAQSFKSDIFGFGNSFYRLKYDKWVEIEKEWPEIFATLPVNIEVKASIKRSGLVNKGLEIK
ncbi:MAG: Ger(x)C family spore germination protein [Halanaerobiales bacterium]